MAELAHWKEALAKRRANAEYLLKGLAPYSAMLQLPSWPDHSEHAFMMFPIVIRDRRIKKSALTRCLETWNIETRDMLPLLNQPVYRRMFGNIEPKYPGAAWVRKNGFYIGCHPGLSRSDLLYTVAVFKEFFRRAGARR